MFSRLLLLIPLLVLALIAAPAGVNSKWKVNYKGDIKTAPKTVKSILLDLNIEGDTVTGTVNIGNWPGEAPIADGKIEGDQITFTATGHLNSTTGIPTCAFVVTLQGDQMDLRFSAVRNPGGPLAAGREYHYSGTRAAE